MADLSLIEFLKHPDAYPEKPHGVRLVQTHISWVFIGDKYAYKLKKPVDFGFLDFSTLEKRKFYVEEELRLNRRFSPEIYLGVVPISEHDGSYFIDDRRNVIEYALKMRRIDEEMTLSSLLARDALSREDVELVGRSLAHIYAGIGSDERSRLFGSPRIVAFNVMENFDQTRSSIGGTVDERTFTALESWSRRFLEENEALFNERAASGHCKECHGDLHLQHVVLEDGRVSVFDCIEFSERLRYGDVAMDVAFLTMDFEANARGDLSRAFSEAFIETSGDASMRKVLPFYKVYRAIVRAKVCSFMPRDPGIDEPSRRAAFDRAERYFDLASRYISQ